MAYCAELLGAEAAEEKEKSDMAPLRSTFAFRARTGRAYRLRQMTAVVSEEMHHQPDLQAVRLAYGGLSRGFDALRKENREAWDTLWSGRVNLVGAPTRWQALADAAYFYLQTSVHGSNPTSTSMFGLAYWPNYHYYRGHVMWDIETFVVPTLILSQPNAARTLLEFRSSGSRARGTTRPSTAIAASSSRGKAACGSRRRRRPERPLLRRTSIT